MIAAFKVLKIGWQIALVLVIFSVLFYTGKFVVETFQSGFESRFIDPRVAKQVKPLNDQIAKYKEDSILVNTNNASLIDTLAEVRTEQLKTVQSLQSIIKQVEDRRKAENTQKELRIEFLESLVKELEKGLPPKECYSVGLFGKIKLIDCPKD
jgi:hypothetical protein